nr:reverse transcriptase domain-containing protein [Tanacetum cinerariifolium]
NLFPPLDNLELTIRRRSHTDPTLLNDFKMATEGNGDPPVPDLRTMDELCQPSLNGRGGPIAPISIQATNFGLTNDMIQQVQNSCQFHGLPGDDANKHLDKFLHVTQSIKVNGVTDDALRLYLFPHSLTHHATAWFDRLPRNSINTFEKMAKMFFGKYFPPSMVTKLRNEITNFCQHLDESLFEVWERYKLSIDRCSGTLPSNTITNPKEDLKGITTHSGNAYQGPTIPTTSSSLPKVVECETKVTKDMVPPTNNRSNKDVQPLVVQFKTPTPNSEPVVAPIIEPIFAPANEQKEKFFKIFQDLNFNISFADARILMPKFGPTIKTLLTNKEKLYELARTPLNEHCSTILLKKLPEKLGDPDKFLILCDFPRMDECLSLADLGASINLMPLLVWNKLSLPELSLTCMTLELSDHSIFRRSSLKTKRALIDVFEGELTLHVGKEAITFNLDRTSRYSANYNDITVNRIEFIDMACEEYSQEVLDFFDVIASENPTPYYDPIVSTSSPTLTPFGDSDFLLKEVDAFRALEDDPTSPEETICEAKTNKSSINEPPEVELKDLPPHLEYAYLEGDDKLPVIIAKDLSDEEKTALITVLKSHKRAIAWKLSDIKGINLKFCTHKILIKDDFKPAVQHQRRVNPKIHDVIKKEVFKLLDAELIYPISESPWVSLVQCVQKKGGFTVVENEENELILTRLVTGWRSRFMVKEGIVLGHKISKNGIEVDKAKVDVIAKLPHPTTIKERFKARLLRWVLLLQEFTFKVIDTKGAENLAADHLSRLENPHQNMLDPKEINETFPLETLNMVSFHGNSSTPWIADFANYHAGNYVIKGISS